jgi:formylglycine-generating enzyme required for sulfatase activity
VEHSVDEPAVDEPAATPPIPPAAVATPGREEGEETIITIIGVDYRFFWCQPAESSMMDGFWIQEATVTQELWRNVMGRESIPPQDLGTIPSRRAMTNIPWNDGLRFIERLQESGVLATVGMEDYHFAVPTEAQWDYAYQKGGDAGGFFVVRDDIFERCDDWFDDENRVIRGSNSYFNGRSLGRYANVGFRLIIQRGAVIQGEEVIQRGEPAAMSPSSI